MSEREKTAIITGGKGFIGGYLVPHLERRGYSVRFFDSTEGNDVTDRQLVLDSMQDGDVIFHLAGVLGTHELQDRAYESTRINVLGAINVFDAARRSGARVVLAAKPNPWLNTYSITKDAAEKFAQMYAQEHGVDIRAGKFFSLYGPGQKIHGVQKAVPTFIMLTLKGEPIPVFGTGNQTADFIYADEATEAMAILGHLDGLGGEVVEIGTGVGTTVNFLAEAIVRLTGSRSRIEHLPMRSGEPLNAQVVADTTKMISLLKFRPTVTLEDGLKETIDWYRQTYFNVKKFVSVSA